MKTLISNCLEMIIYDTDVALKDIDPEVIASAVEYMSAYLQDLERKEDLNFDFD